MRTLILSMTLLLAASPARAGKHNASPEAGHEAALHQARELLELTGAGNLGMQVMDQMVAQLQVAMPNVPGEFWQRMRERFTGDQLVDIAAGVYARHFTDKEIKSLVAFYRTSAGQAWVSKMPAVQKELFTTGQEWGAQIAAQIAQELVAEGQIAAPTPETPADSPASP